MHRPVEISDLKDGASIKCLCGDVFTAKNVDDAWDAYDEHTMKEE